MKTIHKQTLNTVEHQTLNLPVGAKILHIAVQQGEPTVWYLCDPEADVETVAIRKVGTGWDFDPSGLEYIGTVQMDGGMGLVWHYFKVV